MGGWPAEAADYQEILEAAAEVAAALGAEYGVPLRVVGWEGPPGEGLVVRHPGGECMLRCTVAAPDGDAGAVRAELRQQLVAVIYDGLFRGQSGPPAPVLPPVPLAGKPTTVPAAAPHCVACGAASVSAGRCELCGFLQPERLAEEMPIDVAAALLLPTLGDSLRTGQRSRLRRAAVGAAVVFFGPTVIRIVFPGFESDMLRTAEIVMLSILTVMFPFLVVAGVCYWFMQGAIVER